MFTDQTIILVCVCLKSKEKCLCCDKRFWIRDLEIDLEMRYHSLTKVNLLTKLNTQRVMTAYSDSKSALLVLSTVFINFMVDNFTFYFVISERHIFELGTDIYQ